MTLSILFSDTAFHQFSGLGTKPRAGVYSCAIYHMLVPWHVAHEGRQIKRANSSK